MNSYLTVNSVAKSAYFVCTTTSWINMKVGLFILINVIFSNNDLIEGLHVGDSLSEKFHLRIKLFAIFI